MTPVLVVARWVCAGCGRHATTTIPPQGHWRVDGTTSMVWCGTGFVPCPDRPIPIQEG